jgi:hypothetical protein
MLRQSTSSAICVFSLCFRLFGKYFAILPCCQWRMIDPFDARIEWLLVVLGVLSAAGGIG